MTGRQNKITILVFVVSLSLILATLFNIISFLPDVPDIPIDNQEGSEILWQKMYGGSGQDWAYSIDSTSDGGIILAGVSESTNIAGCQNHGGDDIYLLKLFADGSIDWQRKVGGDGNDYAYVVQQSTDGGFYVIGESNSNNLAGTTPHGGYDALIMKLNASGNLEWQQLIGGNDYDNVISLCQTSDGGVIFAGESKSIDISNCINSGNSDVFVYKIHSNGSLDWQQLFGGSGVDRALSIQETLDGDFILFGSSTSNLTNITHYGDYDFYSLLINSTGGLIWQNQYGGNDREWGFSIIQTPDKGFIACGLSSSTDIADNTNEGKWDVYVIRLNASGSLIWQKLYGGSENDLAYEIQAVDSGFLLCGGSWSKNIANCTNHGDRDYYLLKIDYFGNILWQKQYGGFRTDYASSFTQTTDGDIVIAGGSDSRNISGCENNGEWDVYVLYLNSNYTSY